jgi:hypothetical protein
MFCRVYHRERGALICILFVHLLDKTMSTTKIGLSNASLTDMELHGIRQLKLAAEMEIQRLNGDIEKLLNQKWDLVNTVNRYNVALAPHKKLPPEVLRSIIVFATSEPTRLPVSNQGVYAMSHVCFAWRQLVLNTPELWSNISLDGSSKMDNKIRIAREWLSRAQHHPISFTIDRTESNVLENLVKHYPCRALHLSISDWGIGEPPLANISLGALEVLHLHNLSLPKLVGEGFSLPALKSLSVSKIGDLKIIHPVAPQLHYLRIQCPVPHSQVLDLMSLCGRLEDCELNIGPNPKNSSQSPKSDSKPLSVVIPTLRELKLTFHKDTNTPAFLTRLGLSNLSSLSILFKAQPEAEPLDLPIVSRLIVQSGGMPHLQSLVIDETKEPFDLKALLLDTPSLRRLNVSHGVLDADCMDQLSRGDLGAQLRDLTSRHGHDAEAILRMVESRATTSTPFSSVRINGVAADTSASLALRDRIQNLRSTGMVVAFSA